MESYKSPPPPSFVLCVSVAALMYACCGRAAATPALNLHNNLAAGKFQAGLQQQNFLTILTSIEERLRNLDNIYSMQLSQTLENKLDRYSRQLEALDTKIIRLEALVMFNLDKISENISTKNFKDDMAKTNMMKKMDSVYEGISHRLGYMERKHDTNMAKVQAKVDATLTRLEKMEENMMIRDSDMEDEISDMIVAMDDLKATCTNMEGKLLNLTNATLNATKNVYKASQDMNIITRKSMNVLHDNIIETLQYMNNRTSRQFKTAEDNNVLLKNLKSELKEDFNDYANKVADMSSYMWKNSEEIENNLKNLETITNNTKIEVQNGIRSLMVQIGQLSKKENIFSGDNYTLDELNNNLNANFQKILTNQDIFLESCHRLQMDESQIESEISITLENLIDMLEKKMNSETKDNKNLDKLLKNHDGRVVRNLYQINSNVISLFEKCTVNNESMSRRLNKIGQDIDSLFAFVQSTVTEGSLSSPIINDTVFQEKLNKIEAIVTQIFSNQTPPNLRAPEFHDNMNEILTSHIQKLSKSLSSIESHIKKTIDVEDFEKIINKLIERYSNNTNPENDTKIEKNYELKIDNDTRKIIEDIFGTNPNLTKSNLVVENVNSTKRKCKQNQHDLINIRSDLPDNCEDSHEKTHKVKKKGRKNKKKNSFLNLIDVRGNFGSQENVENEYSEEDFEGTTLGTTTENSTTDITTTAINEDTYSFTEITPNDTINRI